MVQLAEPETIPARVEATVNYHRDIGETPYTFTGGPGSLDIRSSVVPDPHRVVMHNGRMHPGDFVLERDGFQFVHHNTRMQSFFDEDEIRRVYYPEMEALVKAETGARRVVVFDHTLRTADDALREERKIREVVQRAHNDYTEWSGPQRVRDVLPDEADDLLSRRFAIVQVWRPIRHPVETFPLAICDARTVAFDDFVLSERRYPNRIGQTYAVNYNPATAGTGSRACAAMRRWCSRSTIRSRTAARVGPHTPPSTIRPLRPTHGRGRASRSARLRFSDW